MSSENNWLKFIQLVAMNFKPDFSSPSVLLQSLRLLQATGEPYKASLDLDLSWGLASLTFLTSSQVIVLLVPWCSSGTTLLHRAFTPKAGVRSDFQHSSVDGFLISKQSISTIPSCFTLIKYTSYKDNS